MKTVFIYALNCPTTGSVRYIGKANNPQHRLRKHLRECCREINHRASWVRSLKSKGLAPVLEVLDEVPEDQWQAWEAAYIQFYREAGFDLVNSTDGGEGVTQTPETRAKIGNSNRGKPGTVCSEQRRQELSLKMRGNKYRLGHTPSEETRKKLSRAMKEYRKKLRLNDEKD